MFLLEFAFFSWVFILAYIALVRLMIELAAGLFEFLGWVHKPFGKLRRILVGDGDLVLEPRVFIGVLISKVFAACVYAAIAHFLGASATVTVAAAIFAFFCIG